MVRPGQFSDLNRDVVEGDLFFPHQPDENLPLEDIPIILVTNGIGMFQPALMTELDWVNHERRVKFFDALETATTVFSQITWKPGEEDIRRE